MLCRFLSPFSLSLVLTLGAPLPGVAVAGLTLLPAETTLAGPERSQRFLLQRQEGEMIGRQVEEEIEWSSQDPQVARVDGRGEVIPVGNGSTKIVAAVKGESAAALVVVTGMQDPFEWTFRNHVLPILTKAGCNTGACHGALAGKGGFRLSLQAYDPESDHFNITRQDRGRRIEFADPGRSLLLAKPTGALPHKGGLRIDPDSDDYRILADWIAHGGAPPREEDAIVERVEVLPERVQLEQGQSQQLIVRAVYTNGVTADVTRWTKWTSTNEAVCRVDGEGRVSIIGPGEGAVTAWFSSQIAVARMSVPYQNALPAEVFAKLESRNFIDEEINRQLERLNLPPSPPCDDATFIRRAFLDTLGTLPTRDEVQAFLADSSEEKRDRLIDELLERPEFVDYWTYKWSDVLMLNGQLLRPKAIEAYYKWIRGHVERNTPWNRFVEEILTATGSSYENGATNFYALYETPEEMTENAAQAFLGLSINCAQCHNHPLEKWTNDQYYAMANLFSRVRAKGWGGERRNGDGLRTLFVVETGELVQPRTGKPQPPTPLDGEPLPFDDSADRRDHLAKWLTAPENPYFAKAITNRVWANFFGVGLVEQIDDMRVSNPASNEELLNRAAEFLVGEEFNLKSLMKEILQSHAWQRSSLAVEGNEADSRFYSRYFPRRLIAEVLHDAVVQVTQVPTPFDQVAFPGADSQKTEFYPLGTRAIQLYDSAVDSYFLRTFGRNPRNIVCECERSNEPSMVQVLHLSNGETVNEKVKGDSGRVDRLVKQLDRGMSLHTLVDEAYLVALSRYPTGPERETFVHILQEAATEERRPAIEDLFWALLTSREFLFNH